MSQKYTQLSESSCSTSSDKSKFPGTVRETEKVERERAYKKKEKALIKEERAKSCYTKGKAPVLVDLTNDQWTSYNEAQNKRVKQDILLYKIVKKSQQVHVAIDKLLSQQVKIQIEIVKHVIELAYLMENLLKNVCPTTIPDSRSTECGTQTEDKIPEFQNINMENVRGKLNPSPIYENLKDVVKGSESAGASRNKGVLKNNVFNFGPF